MLRPAILVLAMAMLAAGQAAAQTPQWPVYTEEQRWTRMAQQGTLGVVAAMAYAKEKGATLEEFGRWWGDMFVPSWGQPGSYGPFEVMRGMRRNVMSWPGMEVEVLSQTETAVTARMNRPWTAYFGDSGTWYGITLEEFERLNSMFMQRVADYHGLAFEERRDGESWVLTFSRR
jgi:hypothetical protein